MSSEFKNYEELLHNYKKLQIELESANQALYECRRQVKTTQSLEAEYQDEIRILQSQGTVEQQKLEAKVTQLEENIINLKAMFTERTNCLEKELTMKEDEITFLKKEMNDIVQIAGTQEPVIDDKLIEELRELREENSELEINFCKLENELQQSEQQRLLLTDTVKQLQEELQDYKEMLQCKNEELKESNALIQNLKDDYWCVKAELDMVHSKPLDDQSRGNSLFAEVDDRRVQLQQNMSLMKSQYIEMKRERASLLKQISTLRNENTSLIMKCQAEIDGRERDDEMILNSYKYQIQTLNELIESYKKELKQKEQNLEDVSPNQAVKFFDGMLAMKNEEIEELRNKLSSRSLNHTTLSYDLAEANRKIRRYDLEIIELKNEIGKLKNEIEGMKIVSPVEKTPIVDPAPKSIVKSVNLTDTNNENENTSNKKVQFTENTTEPQITERNKRRGAKVMVLKPKQYY